MLQPETGEVTTTASITEPVKTAFALGWQMARLYTGPLSSDSPPKLAEDLPGLSDLPSSSLVQLGLTQAGNALKKLSAFLGATVTLPSTQRVGDALGGSPSDPGSVRQAILDLHVALLITLTAADYRLGKAYGLGRALADTCASSIPDAAERKEALEHHLEPHRALVIIGWLDDLKTLLPPHSAQAVLDSLQRWTDWGQAVNLSTLDANAVSQATRVFHRCGQRWRALLSGEKDAMDTLDTQDYVTAARGTLGRAGAIARSFAVQLWAPLSLAGMLIGLGIVLIIVNNSTAQVIAGLGTVAGGLGVTWRSAASSAGRLSLDLVRPLWNAQLDLVIASSLTPLPQRNYPLPRPRRGRLRRAWRELLTRNARPSSPTSTGSPPETPDTAEIDTPARTPPPTGDQPVT